jgi:hypothetical protein
LVSQGQHRGDTVAEPPKSEGFVVAAKCCGNDVTPFWMKVP